MVPTTINKKKSLIQASNHVLLHQHNIHSTIHYFKNITNTNILLNDSVKKVNYEIIANKNEVLLPQIDVES